MTKTLNTNLELLEAGDRALVEGMLNLIKAQPADVQLKTIRPMLMNNPKYKENLAKIISVIGGTEARGGIGTKIVAWLQDQANQAQLRAESAQMAGYKAELQKMATITVDMTDPKFRVKFLEDESGNIVDVAIKIPVQDTKMAVDFWAKVKESQAAFNQTVLTLLRKANIAGEKTERLPGVLETDTTGKWVLRLPERKAQKPRDPNAPAAAPSAKGAKWELVFGEGENAVQVATDIPSKPAIVNKAAVWAHANPDKFGGNPPFTVRDETIGSVNFGRAYAPRMEKWGFHWKEVTNGHTEPAKAE